MAQKGTQYVSKKKGSKKGTKKKQTDTFSKKEWFSLRAPSSFLVSSSGKTLATRSSAKQNLDKLLLNRCFEVNQADLQNQEESNFRKFKFLITKVKGKEAIGEFYSMNLTTDKARGIIKKWHTLIEGDMLVKTQDGYTLRVFVMAQSKRPEGYVKARCYVQSTKVKQIRQVMFEVIGDELENLNIDKVCQKLMEEKVGKEIERRGSEVYPLMNCFVKKVMVVKRPKVVEEVESETAVEVEENWE